MLSYLVVVMLARVKTKLAVCVSLEVNKTTVIALLLSACQTLRE